MYVFPFNSFETIWNWESVSVKNIQIKNKFIGTHSFYYLLYQPFRFAYLAYWYSNLFQLMFLLSQDNKISVSIRHKILLGKPRWPQRRSVNELKISIKLIKYTWLLSYYLNISRLTHKEIILGQNIVALKILESCTQHPKAF